MSDTVDPGIYSPVLVPHREEQACYRGELTAIVMANYDRFLSVAANITGSPDDAYDAVAAVFEKAISGYNGFSNAGNLAGYLLVAIRNEALKINLRKTRHTALEVTHDFAGVSDEHILNARIDGKRFLELLPKILPLHLLLVVLLWLEDYSHAEIAAELGISPEASRQKLSRAIRLLKSAFNPDDDGGGRKGRNNKRNTSGAEEVDSDIEALDDNSIDDVVFKDTGQFIVYEFRMHGYRTNQFNESGFEDLLTYLGKGQSTDVLIKLSILEWVVTDHFACDVYPGLCILLEQFSISELVELMERDKNKLWMRNLFPPNSIDSNCN